MSEVLSSPDGSRILELPDIEPLLPDFMDADVEDVFDWPEVFGRIVEGYGWDPTEGRTIYLVVFRSVRKPDADSELLTRLDDEAYLEAQASPALLLYHKGELAADGTCVSFCIWTSGKEAWLATRGPAHQRAASVAEEMYEPYFVDHVPVTVENGHVTFGVVKR